MDNQNLRRCLKPSHGVPKLFPPFVQKRLELDRRIRLLRDLMPLDELREL